jgi:hypothetical protein
VQDGPLQQQVIADTQRWLERAVIGLNLCPFAKAVHAKGQVHYAVCLGDTPQDILDALDAELADLAAARPEQRDTTLLMLPNALHDFLAFNDFLGRCEKRIRRMNLEGVIQLAHFHPDYCFADALPQDPANFTNRAPHPTLHLLREDSIERAGAAFPDAASIYEANIRRLRELGEHGWRALGTGRT